MLAAMELLSQLWLHIAYIKLKCVKSQASPDTRPLSSQASPDPCPLSSQASPDNLHARIESGIARPCMYVHTQSAIIDLGQALPDHNMNPMGQA